MRWLAWAAVAVTLTGCGPTVDPEVRRCWQAPNIQIQDKCIERYNARVARGADDGDAAIMLLGATAFSNGYTQSRPAMVTCYRTGMMTMCQ